jgi:hypothetical protein
LAATISLWSWQEGYNATSGDTDHLSHFGGPNVEIADRDICGRNSHHHLVPFDDLLVGIRLPNVGLGIPALSRIINSKSPAKTAALASPNMTNSISNERWPNWLTKSAWKVCT